MKIDMIISADYIQEDIIKNKIVIVIDLKKELVEIFNRLFLFVAHYVIVANLWVIDAVNL